MLSYLLFGLHLQSEVPLPVPTGTSAASVDVLIRRHSAAQPPVPDGPEVVTADHPLYRGVLRAWRGPGGSWLWHQGLGMVHIGADGRRVDVYPEAGANEQLLGLVLAGQVALHIVQRRGTPVLHASAVVTARGAVAFFGPHGRGKSSMAAAFLHGGATLLTDDALLLWARGERIVSPPGPPLMKVWPATAQRALGLAEELPGLAEGVEKRLLTLDGRYPAAPTPAPFAALYLLDRYDPARAGRTDCTVQTLEGQEALLALVAQTSYKALLLPSELAPFLAMYARLLRQAPLRLLTYPSGFEHRETVRAAILTDLTRPLPGRQRLAAHSAAIPPAFHAAVTSR